MRDRALAALDALVRGAASGPIAIVTHDAVIRPILESIQPGIEAEVETGTWADLTWDGQRWAVASVDNTAD